MKGFIGSDQRNDYDALRQTLYSDLSELLKISNEVAHHGAMSAPAVGLVRGDDATLTRLRFAFEFLTGLGHETCHWLGQKVAVDLCLYLAFALLPQKTL